MKKEEIGDRGSWKEEMRIKIKRRGLTADERRWTRIMGRDGEVEEVSRNDQWEEGRFEI